MLPLCILHMLTSVDYNRNNKVRFKYLDGINSYLVVYKYLCAYIIKKIYKLSPMPYRVLQIFVVHK